MNQQINILAVIKEKMGMIILGGLFLAAFSFLFLIISEKNFKVSTDYLVVQNQTGAQDFYTLSKSAEYVGKVLGEGVYSELFINEVIKTGKVNQEFLPFDKKEKIKAWSKMVRINRNAELGIFSVVVLDNNQKEGMDVSSAIADVLINKNALFLGDGQNVNTRILSGPVWEKNPSITNIIFAVIGGFILGLLLSLINVYYQAGNQLKTRGFGTPAGGKIIFQSNDANNKQRMENSGIFAEEDKYKQ